MESLDCLKLEDNKEYLELKDSDGKNASFLLSY